MNFGCFLGNCNSHGQTITGYFVVGACVCECVQGVVILQGRS